MTTWFLVRSAPRSTAVTTTAGTTVTVTNGAMIKGNTGSKGPLKRRIVDTSPVTANIIPFMGDANVGDVKDRFLDEDIKGTDGTLYLTAGVPLVETSSDGPYFSGNGTSAFGKWGTAAVVLATATTTTGGTTYGGIAGDEQPEKGVAKKGNTQLSHLQDFRDFGPVHGGSANVLFADGSVKVFQDKNGDGFLNPGHLTTGTGSGYVAGDNTVELPEAEIFSGVLLEPFNTTNKGNTD
jgi:prepilin-type processing-associated H-X9-DG protein